MPVAANKASVHFAQSAQGGWWFKGPAFQSVAAGVADRQVAARDMKPFGRKPAYWVEAEQVHGAGIAVVEEAGVVGQKPVAGCDGLVTSQPGTALLIQTADCLPIFFVDSKAGVAGLAHAGWRGLFAQLPMRVASVFRMVYGIQPDQLTVAIGPSIRACCYEVGAEFEGYFGRFVARRDGRRVCDLAGVAVDQLQRSGVKPGRILDSGICTACDLDRWFSLRREGPSTGRLTSLIMVL